jgi:hypothetical protein
MPDKTLQRRVLQALTKSKTGLTERQLVAALRPSQKLTFDEEVERSAAIGRALKALKLEHRAWPTDKAEQRTWAITSRGKRK